jgi:hypothetical protein
MFTSGKPRQGDIENTRLETFYVFFRFGIFENLFTKF